MQRFEFFTEFVYERREVKKKRKDEKGKEAVRAMEGLKAMKASKGTKKTTSKALKAIKFDAKPFSGAASFCFVQEKTQLGHIGDH